MRKKTRLIFRRFNPIYLIRYVRRRSYIRLSRSLSVECLFCYEIDFLYRDKVLLENLFENFKCILERISSHLIIDVVLRPIDYRAHDVTTRASEY